LGANLISFRLPTMIPQELLEAIMNRDRYYRSQIIYLETTINTQISECIAWHFCQDEKKHLAFMALLFNRGEIPFSKKIDIFEFILKKDYPDLYAECKGFISKLNALRRIRNKFAHSSLVLDDLIKLHKQKVENGIYIRTLDREGNKKDEFFSEDDLKARTDEYTDLMFELIKLTWEFERRAKGKEPRSLAQAWESLFEHED
jgi:hypothetical protein